MNMDKIALRQLEWQQNQIVWIEQKFRPEHTNPNVHSKIKWSEIKRPEIRLLASIFGQSIEQFEKDQRHREECRCYQNLQELEACFDSLYHAYQDVAKLYEVTHLRYTDLERRWNNQYQEMGRLYCLKWDTQSHGTQSRSSEIVYKTPKSK